MAISILESKLDSLREFLNPDAAARWHNFITTASDEQLRRINAFELAAYWQLDGRDVLTVLIHATRAGLMVLNWDLICSMCGAANTHNHLNTVCALQVCGGCGGKFDVILDQTVEVTFTIHPSIRALTPSAIECARTGATRYVTGLDCATLPAFREFFAADVLSLNESLQVRDVAIMFTDIKGSTQLYENLGDARAYQAVRRHFDALFATVAENQGVIIKTIGDAVMASFTQPLQAMRAALAAQEAFTEFRPLLPDFTEALIVKIGIHHGPCIAVTLNNRLDFFGGTVNIAARTQQQAGGGEVLITETMYRDPQVSELLNENRRTIRGLQTRLRGLSSEFMLYKITD